MGQRRRRRWAKWENTARVVQWPTRSHAEWKCYKFSNLSTRGLYRLSLSRGQKSEKIKIIHYSSWGKKNALQHPTIQSQFNTYAHNKISEREREREREKRRKDITNVQIHSLSDCYVHPSFFYYSNIYFPGKMRRSFCPGNKKNRLKPILMWKEFFSFSSYSPLFGVITSLNPPHKEKKNKVRVSFFGYFPTGNNPGGKLGNRRITKKKRSNRNKQKPESKK
jgi:hypothetical protein